MITWPSHTDSVIIQGMTGKEGSRMMRWMRASGTNVCAGVTPGKGGSDVDGVPVFNSVADARTRFPDSFVSCVAVPAAFVRSAVKEALEGGVRFVYVLSEHVPVHDVLAIRSLARTQMASVLGPASVGFVCFPAFQLGYLGGQNVFEHGLQEGDAAVLSTSGGMTNEILMGCARANVGVRFAAALGGGTICGITLTEAVADAQDRADVRRLAIFTEPGQPLLTALLDGRLVLHKPAVLFLAGRELDNLPKGVPYGHTGTLLGEGQRTVSETISGLKALGIRCASTMDDFFLQLQSL